MDQHDHVYLGDRHDENGRRTLWVVAITLVAMVGEVAGGWIFGSMALLADGFHMATHAGAMGVAWAAYAYARRHATNRSFSFGTGKVGDLAGFASALILGIAALAIGVESAERLLNPARVAFTEAAVVAVLGLVVNLFCAWLLGGHGHGHDHGHDHDHDHEPHGVDHDRTPAQDNNLRSAYLHVLADALTSVMAIAALLAGRWLGWTWADAATGILGAVVIARWSWGLMRDTAAVLLDRADTDAERAIRARIEGGGVRIVDIHVWRIGPDARAAIVSVEGGMDRSAVLDRLSAVPGLDHVTVECRGAG